MIVWVGNGTTLPISILVKEKRGGEGRGREGGGKGEGRGREGGGKGEGRGREGEERGREQRRKR